MPMPTMAMGSSAALSLSRQKLLSFMVVLIFASSPVRTFSHRDNGLSAGENHSFKQSFFAMCSSRRRLSVMEKQSMLDYIFISVKGNLHWSSDGKSLCMSLMLCDADDLCSTIWTQNGTFHNVCGSSPCRRWTIGSTFLLQDRCLEFSPAFFLLPVYLSLSEMRKWRGQGYSQTMVV